MPWIEEIVRAGAIGAVIAERDPVVVSRLRGTVLIEHVTRVRWCCEAVPDRRGDDPRVDLDALGMRLRDERIERVKWERCDARLRARHHRTVAEAIPAASHLDDERVEARGLRLRDELGDLRLVEDALAERIHPVRAELTLSGTRRRGPKLHENREKEQD